MQFLNTNTGKPNSFGGIWGGGGVAGQYDTTKNKINAIGFFIFLLAKHLQLYDCRLRSKLIILSNSLVKLSKIIGTWTI